MYKPVHATVRFRNSLIGRLYCQKFFRGTKNQRNRLKLLEIWYIKLYFGKDYAFFCKSVIAKLCQSTTHYKQPLRETENQRNRLKKAGIFIPI